MFDFIKDDQMFILLFENVGFIAYDAHKAAEKGWSKYDAPKSEQA